MRPTNNITPTKKSGTGGKTPMPYAPIPYPGPQAPGKHEVDPRKINPPKPKKKK
jgi:hypothetical protein